MPILSSLDGLTIGRTFPWPEPSLRPRVSPLSSAHSSSARLLTIFATPPIPTTPGPSKFLKSASLTAGSATTSASNPSGLNTTVSSVPMAESPPPQSRLRVPMRRAGQRLGAWRGDGQFFVAIPAELGARIMQAPSISDVGKKGFISNHTPFSQVLKRATESAPCKALSSFSTPVHPSPIPSTAPLSSPPQKQIPAMRLVKSRSDFFGLPNKSPSKACPPMI